MEDSRTVEECGTALRGDNKVGLKVAGIESRSFQVDCKTHHHGWAILNTLQGCTCRVQPYPHLFVWLFRGARKRVKERREMRRAGSTTVPLRKENCSGPQSFPFSYPPCTLPTSFPAVTWCSERNSAPLGRRIARWPAQVEANCWVAHVLF